MNKFIQKELESCRIAQIPIFDENTTHITIPKINSAHQLDLFEEPQLRVNGYFLIKFGSYVTNPPPTFTLAETWNNGTKPLTPYNKVQVLEIKGKMVRLECVGYDNDTQTDLNNMWAGWVPIKLVTIISTL